MNNILRIPTINNKKTTKEMVKALDCYLWMVHMALWIWLSLITMIRIIIKWRQAKREHNVLKDVQKTLDREDKLDRIHRNMY